MKLQILDYLRESFGLEDEDLMEIYSSYLSAFETELANAKKSIESDDCEVLRRAAHTIKGCALNCGDNQTATYAKELQDIATSGDITECKKYLTKLEESFEVLKKSD